MKKRVVAVLLSLSMCLASGAEAGIVSAADFTSGETSVQAEDIQAEETQTEAVQAAEIQESAMEAEALADEPAADPEISTEDNGTAEVTPEAESSSAEETAAEDAVIDFGFDDGTGADTAGESAPTEAPQAEETKADAAETSFESFEAKDQLKYTRWENASSDKKDSTKWRLRKYQSASAAAAGTASDQNTADGAASSASETGTDSVAVSPEEAFTSDDGTAGTDSAAVTVETTEAADAAGAAEAAEAAPEANDGTPAAESNTEPEAEADEQPAEAAEITLEPTADDSADASSEENTDAVGTVDPSQYYTSADGVVKITTLDASGKTLQTGYYYFDKNGYMVTGAFSPDDSSVYYFLASGDVQVTNTTINAVYKSTPAPYNSKLGQALTSGWRWNGTAWESYGADGKKAASITAGIYEINGSTYYLKSTGVPYVGGNNTIKYNGKSGTYYFQPKADDSDIPGKMAKSKWCLITSKGVKYYRYFDANGCYVKKAAGAYKIGDKTYLLRASGSLVINKPMYAANGAQYFSDKNGVIRRSQLVTYNNNRYYFGSDGKRVSWKNCWKRIASADNKYYYFGSVAGRVQKTTGWQKITVSGKYIGWFYFSSYGNMQKGKWMGGGTYYFLSDGRLASGVTKVDGKYYYFQKSTSSQRRGKVYKSAWIKDTKNGKTVYYRASKSGVLVKQGWYKSGGSYYYFQNYNTVCNKTGLYNPKTKEWGITDSQGKFGNGWVVMDDANNKVMYISKTTGKLVKSKVVTIDGKEYRFDSSGYRVSDRTGEAKYSNLSSYYLECDRVNGVMTVYTNSSKTVPVKTIRVSVGAASLGTTPLGKYRLSRAGRWQTLMGPSYGQYGTHVDGAGYGGIFIHSIACGSPNSYNLPTGEYMKLGTPASHGCIRCCVADAKWVWDHCNGSYIYIFDGTYTSQNSKKGPLGRNPITPLRGSKNFDPTDPAC